MKRVFFAILLYSFFSSLQAQNDEEVGLVSRFGIAGGFTPIIVFPNLSPINDELNKLGIDEFSTSGMLNFGGSGYAYIMLIDNLRIGGIGFGGTLSRSKIINGYSNEINYNYGIGGLTIEYSLPFINKIAVSVGTIIGAGSSSIEIYRNKSNFSWDDIWKENTTQNINRKLSNTFFTIAPMINADFPITRFMAVRLGVGYAYSFNDNWKADNDQSLIGVPADLNSKSFFIQTGIYFGFFAL
ncbi:hypothetical protein ABRY23_13665 [Melioribacteraceae bacterium 4301-Me]|uniref:hypothetical protein n=1 Tax=Pyranulibacter aquaticus TaxID=3163344 RepID=UPI0035954047